MKDPKLQGFGGLATANVLYAVVRVWPRPLRSCFHGLVAIKLVGSPDKYDLQCLKQDCLSVTEVLFVLAR